jgi:hypothetical protein
MCVVDRRSYQDPYFPEVKPARVQAPLQNCVPTGSIDSGGLDPFEPVSVPAHVEIEGESSLIPGEDEQGGVPVVEGTPGTGALLQIMLKRVWGVQVDEESLATPTRLGGFTSL